MSAEILLQPEEARLAVERRRYPRYPAARNVLFEALEGELLPRRGILVDLSREGFQIRSVQHMPAGGSIRVHIAPSATRMDSALICAKGRVVRILSLPDGSYAMGVRIQLEPLESSLPTQRPRPTVVFGARQACNGVQPSSLRLQQSASFSVLQRKPMISSSARRRRWLLLLILPILLFLGWPYASKPSSNTEALAKGSLPGVKRLDSSCDAAAPMIRTPDALAATDGLEKNLIAADRAGGGAWENRRFETPPRRPIPPGRAYWMARRNGASLSATAVWRLARDGEINETPTALLYDPAQRGDAYGAFYMAAPQEVREVFPVYPHVSEWEHLSVALAIHKHAHLLTMHRHGATAQVFRVGLGRDGSTPSGEYRIATKILHPDWWRHGKTIPAGDPRNPLGEYWMGLSRGGEPLPIGLHPTSEPATLGVDASEGCIRLSPEDARVLFAQCPSGTIVRIQE